MLFWNIKNNSRTIPVLSQLCEERGIDIVILSEASNIDEQFIIKNLKKANKNFDVTFSMPSNRTVLFHNKAYKIKKHHDGTFYSLFKIIENNSITLLVSLHLPSMLHFDEDDIGHQAALIKREIELFEEKLETNKTIVVGDFNLNPFSRLLVSATGFNAVMDKKLANKKYRTVAKEKYFYFYNPMWTLHGNNNNDVLGTYFYHSKPTSYAWNMFDQVLIRPQLINRFVFNELEIVHRVGSNSLLTTHGRPNDKLYSDHLPIKFELR